MGKWSKIWAVVMMAVVGTLPARGQREGPFYGKWLPELRIDPFGYGVRPLTVPADTIEIFIIGDVMMHSRQFGYDFREFLSGISERISGADLAIANMEFTLAGEPYTGYPCFSAPDTYATYVADYGVDVFLTANNHILDKGPKGLERTMRKYRELHPRVRFTGVAENEDSLARNYPLRLAMRGVRVALLNFTYGTNVPNSSATVNYMDKEAISRAISRCEGADVVIALPHWGNEYQLRHSHSQEEMAHWLVSQGVDAVVGSHPHVVQDSCQIDGAPVFYSLGNAVSNMSARNTRLELAVTLRIERGSDGSVRMLAPKTEYLWCTLPGTLTQGYKTISVRAYLGRRHEWKNPSDYDNMVQTYFRVRKETGVSD